MPCIYCADAVSDQGTHQIVPAAFGSTLVSHRLLCLDCHNAFVNNPQERAHPPFVAQFTLLRNLFEVGDAAGQTPPPVIVDAKAARFGRSVHLGPGGAPIHAKELRESFLNDQGELVVVVKGVDLKRAIPELMEPAQRTPEHNAVRAEAINANLAFLNRQLELKVEIGGDVANRAVLKDLYGLLFHQQRDRGIDLGLAVEDFIDLREFIRYGSLNEFVYASLDFQNRVDHPIPEADYGHYLFLFGSRNAQLLFGKAVYFGHVEFSAVLNEHYRGEDFGFGARIDPHHGGAEYWDDLAIPPFDPLFHKRFLSNHHHNLLQLGEAMTRQVESRFESEAQKARAGQPGAALVRVEDANGAPIDLADPGASGPSKVHRLCFRLARRSAA